MKHELEYVRNMARNRIESGALPERSWDRYVKLIEAAEAVLHDMAVLVTPADATRPAPGQLRLVAPDASARAVRRAGIGFGQSAGLPALRAR